MIDIDRQLLQSDTDRRLG